MKLRGATVALSARANDDVESVALASLERGANQKLRRISLLAGVSIKELSLASESELLIQATSPLASRLLFRYLITDNGDDNVTLSASDLVQATPIFDKVDPLGYTVSRDEVVCDDGEIIKLTITRAEKTPLDGSAPAILYANS